MNLSFTKEQVSAFRLHSHNLIEKEGKNILKICSNVCGVQAQVLSAAYLSLNCRIQNITKSKIDKELIKNRSLVRTSLMRQTLHLIPSNEFSIYINALKRSRIEAYTKVIARFGVAKKDTDKLNKRVVDLLSDGPVNKSELVKIVRPMLNKNLTHWSEFVWNIFKPAIIEGLICYYPSNGNKSTFIRTERWLPVQKEVPEEEAKTILVKKYLKAYGPATAKDFAYWAGMLMKEATDSWNSIKDEMIEIKVEDETRYILKKDLSDLKNSAFDKAVINLLPNFDVYLLGHSGKDHIIKKEFYKKVFRNAGWISSVILLNGRIIGIWTMVKNGGRIAIKIELFDGTNKKLKNQIRNEISIIENFTNDKFEIRFGK